MVSQRAFSDCVKAASALGGRMLMPQVDKLLPRVASIAQKALLADSAQWARTIMQTTDLVEGDAIAICVDPDMTLLGCGAELIWDADKKRCADKINLAGELNTAGLTNYLQMLEAVVRSPLRNKPCAVAMQGPATLAARIFQEVPSKAHFGEVKGTLTALAELICQLRPELILFIEDEATLNQTTIQDLRRIYNTLKNVADYYEVGTGLLVDSITPGQAQALSILRLDALLICELQADDVLSALLSATADWPLLGLSLPINDLGQAQTMLAQIDAASVVDPAKIFYITPGQLSQDCDLEQFRAAKKQIGGGES